MRKQEQGSLLAGRSHLVRMERHSPASFPLPLCMPSLTLSLLTSAANQTEENISAYSWLLIISLLDWFWLFYAKLKRIQTTDKMHHLLYE